MGGLIFGLLLVFFIFFTFGGLKPFGHFLMISYCDGFCLCFALAGLWFGFRLFFSKFLMGVGVWKYIHLSTQLVCPILAFNYYGNKLRSAKDWIWTNFDGCKDWLKVNNSDWLNKSLYDYFQFNNIFFKTPIINWRLEKFNGSWLGH